MVDPAFAPDPHGSLTEAQREIFENFELKFASYLKNCDFDGSAYIEKVIKHNNINLTDTIPSDMAVFGGQLVVDAINTLCLAYNINQKLVPKTDGSDYCWQCTDDFNACSDEKWRSEAGPADAPSFSFFGPGSGAEAPLAGSCAATAPLSATYQAIPKDFKPPELEGILIEIKSSTVVFDDLYSPIIYLKFHLKNVSKDVIGKFADACNQDLNKQDATNYFGLNSTATINYGITDIEVIFTITVDTDNWMIYYAANQESLNELKVHVLKILGEHYAALILAPPAPVAISVSV